MDYSHDYPGKLIILEGCEGAGKTSLMPFLKACLEKLGYEVVMTKEPDCGTPRCRLICKNLLSLKKPLSAVEILDLMIECRKENFGKIVIPALKKGKIILCDRSYGSTVAYQHYGYGLDLTDILKKDALARQNVNADLIFLLDIDPVIGLERKDKDINRFEKMPLDFHRRVRNGYLQQWEDDKDDKNKVWHLIDASFSREVIEETVVEIIYNAILRRKNVKIY